MSDKYTTARINIGGEKFEIILKPDLAFDCKMGKEIPISKILLIEEIYSDAGKGSRVSSEKLQEAFSTTDVLKIAEEILKSGELQITTEQKRKLIEDKRKQIIAFISRNCLDPRTGAPHPPLRVEQAMSQVKMPIDPFKGVEEQSKLFIEQLRTIIPIKMEKMQVAVKIFPEYAGKAYGMVKELGNVVKEEWLLDGSWAAIVEMPAGIYSSFVDKLGKATQGTVQTKILK
ncbi:MAG: ribosome assembly factor SBDS [Candidatus Bathyarchaeota archaeon]|nr:ribosome assembly factor SBDS [Candidatus Bathyarchaeota archaeon]